VDGALPTTSLSSRASRRELLDALVELTKPRITKLVTITSAVGFVLAAFGRDNWLTLDLLLAAIGCVVGTALSASGASALNQLAERDRDALMPRTCARPLPQRRVSPRTALLVGALLTIAGVTTLALLAGPVPAAVSLTTTLLYLLVYTPLKPVTTLSTIVGAVPGALPPLIGWTAAAQFPEGSLLFAPLLVPAGWSLFLLMFVWQIPHFLAIAWMYRDDYAKGGYRTLPLLDPTGAHTSRTILLWSVALLPATLAPVALLPGRLGLLYTVLALAGGLAFIAFAVRFAIDHSRKSARRVFIASVIHLPALLVGMLADAGLHRLI
jgi:protoheme IX farnesyltransferase